MIDENIIEPSEDKVKESSKLPGDEPEKVEEPTIMELKDEKVKESSESPVDEPEKVEELTILKSNDDKVEEPTESPDDESVKTEKTPTPASNGDETAPSPEEETDPPPLTPETENIFPLAAEEIDGFEEIIVDMGHEEPIDEETAKINAEMEKRYLETMKEFRRGELVIGKVVAINESDITVDIGFKSEGAIPIEEFDHPKDVKVGNEIEVLIDRVEDAEGTLVLSKKKAEFNRIWENINSLYQSGEMVEAQIIRRIKGGMVVDLFTVEAFLPGSQIDVHPIRDFDALVNVTMDFRIIKVNNIRKNVVLSHKVLVEESLREIRDKVLKELEEGQVVEGIVKNITDFGVFVDLGGVDGLLHITDLSWGRVSHPSDVVQLDEKIKVKVLHYDKERQRISLGLKQLQEHHWDNIEEKYPINEKTQGKIVSLVKYGAFIELEQGVEGLVHISEMSWTQHIKHPSQMVSVGDIIDIIVLNIDAENRKISLGMKQCLEDPWEKLELIYTTGTKHKGVVRDLVPFGAFVELEQGIDGLIHISDLSWTRKVRHPGEIVKKGDEIEVVILNFDRNERRIALGFKQLEDDPWDDFEKEYQIRSKCDGSVIRVLEKGVVVVLSMGVEGFIPNSQLGKSIAGENKRDIKDGDNLQLEVIEFDKNNHRIVLSHSIVEHAKDKATYRAYKDVPDDSKATFGDLMRESQKESKAGVSKSLDKAVIKEPQVETKEPKAAAESGKITEITEPADKPETEPQPDETKDIDATEQTVTSKSAEKLDESAKPDEPIGKTTAEPKSSEKQVEVSEPDKTEDEPDKTAAEPMSSEKQVVVSEPDKTDVKPEKTKPEPKSKKETKVEKKPIAKPKEKAKPTADKTDAKDSKAEESAAKKTKAKAKPKTKPTETKATKKSAVSAAKTSKGKKASEKSDAPKEKSKSSATAKKKKKADE